MADTLGQVLPVEPATGEVLGPADTVRWVLSRAPFAAPDTFELPAGLSVLDALETLAVPPRVGRRCVVVLGPRVLPLEAWGRTRPKAGLTVRVGVRPAGGGEGSNPLRTVLQLLVAVGSTFLAATGNPLAAAAVQVLGNLAVNALVPPPRPRAQLSQPDSAPSYAVETASNEARLFGPVPVVLGQRRQVLLHAARPYTEVVGDDLHYRLLLTPGVGPCSLTDLRLGATALSAYQDVEVEVRQGLPGELPVTLFVGTPREASPGVDLTAAAGWVERDTDPDTDEISVDFTWGQGLFALDNNANRVPRTVALEVRWRRVEDPTGWTSVLPTATEANTAAATVFGAPRSRLEADAWSPLEDANWRAGVAAASQGALTYTSQERRPVRRNVRWAVPRGRYRVAVRRVTADATVDSVVDVVTWSALRSVKAAPPQVPVGTPLVALRVRASGQLQGRLEPVSALVTSLRRAYSAGTSWGAGLSPTRNPADLFLAVLQGPGNSRPQPDALVDWQSLADWHGVCAARGWTCDLVLDGGASVAEALEVVAQAGRARTVRRAGRLGVVADVPRAPSGQLFGPRNTRGFQGVKRFAPPVHALRVRFANVQKDYREDELVVYVPGQSAATATLYETLSLDTATSAALAEAHARFWLAVNQHRSETFEFEADWEHAVTGVGEVCYLTHDTVHAGAVQARVKGWLDQAGQPLAAGSGTVWGLVLDEAVSQTAGQLYGLQVRRPAGVTTVALVTTPGTSAQVQFQFSYSATTAPQVGDLVAFGVRDEQTLEVVLTRKGRPGQDGAVPLTAEPYAHPEVDQAGTPSGAAHTSLVRRTWRPVPPEPELRQAVWLEDGVVVDFHLATDTERPVEAVEARWRETPAAGASTAWTRLPDLTSTDRRVLTPPPRLSESVDVELTSVGPDGQRSLPLLVLAVESTEQVAVPAVQSVTGVSRTGSGGSLPVVELVQTPTLDARVVQVEVEVAPLPAGTPSRALAPVSPWAARVELAVTDAPGGALAVRVRARSRRGAVSAWSSWFPVTFPALTAGTATVAAALVGQGALATQNTAAWGTQVSGRPTNLAALNGSEGVNNALVRVGQNALVDTAWARGQGAWANLWDGNSGLPIMWGVDTVPGFFGARRVLGIVAQGTPAAGTVWGFIATSGESLATLRRYAVPVRPGDRVALSVLAARHKCDPARLMALFWGNDGTRVGEFEIARGGRVDGGANGDPSNFDRVGGFVTAPASAAHAGFYVHGIANGTGVWPTVLVSEPFLAVVAPGQTELPPYGPGQQEPRADETATNVAAAIFNQAPAATDPTVASGATRNGLAVAALSSDGAVAVGSSWADLVTASVAGLLSDGSWELVVECDHQGTSTATLESPGEGGSPATYSWSYTVELRLVSRAPGGGDEVVLWSGLASNGVAGPTTSWPQWKYPGTVEPLVDRLARFAVVPNTRAGARVVALQARRTVGLTSSLRRLFCRAFYLR